MSVGTNKLGSQLVSGPIHGPDKCTPAVVTSHRDELAIRSMSQYAPSRTCAADPTITGVLLQCTIGRADGVEAITGHSPEFFALT
jgi:hypothetical protein